MTRILRHPLTLLFLYIVFLAIIANVIVWLTGWSLLWVLLAVMSTGILLLYWFKSRRRRRAQHAVESLPDTEQKV